MTRFLLLLILAAGLHAETLRVMTFNVRYPNPSDGADLWTARRELFAATVKKHAPDLMGTQELFYEQGQFIVEKLPEYGWFGLSRRGNQQDEHMGVFYRKEKLTLIDSGNFWLSPTAERAGSSAWGMSLPRMVTWGVFEVKAGGTRFLYYNTHFPHRAEDEAARRMCAKLIADRLSLYDEKMPLVLTGDFNAGAHGGAYDTLTGMLKDTWKEAAKRSEGSEGTFHGFKGKPGRERIDWILYRAPWRVVSTEILTDHEGDRYPSDHFPVLSVFELP